MRILEELTSFSSNSQSREHLIDGNRGSSMNEPFLKAVELINNGDLAGAQRILVDEVRRRDPENVAAWALMASIANTPFRMNYSLNQVLRLRPGLPWAERKLRELTGSSENGRQASEFQAFIETSSPLHPSSHAEVVWLPEQDAVRFEAPRSGFSRALHSIITGALSLILVASIVLLLAPRLLGSNLLVVQSQSMEPAVPMGSVVISRPLPSSEIVEGDVITFRSVEGFGQTELITHRVIEVHSEGLGVRFRTQGDAVDEADRDLVLGSDVLGKVWFAVPLAGFLLAFIRTPLGFAIIVGIPASFVIAGEVVTIAESFRSGENPASSQDIGQLERVRA